jgi:hypothetical protein
MQISQLHLCLVVLLLKTTWAVNQQQPNTAVPLTKSGDHQVMFYETGLYAGDVAWSHISIPIDGQKIIDDINAKMRHLVSYIEVLDKHGHQSYGELNKDIVSKGYSQLDNYLEVLVDLFTSPLSEERAERFIGLIAVFVSTLLFSAIGNGCNMIALSHIGDKLTNLEKVQNNILELEDVHDGALHKLDIYVQNITHLLSDEFKYSPAIVQSSLDRLLFEAQSTTEQLIDTFQALQDHRLSHTLLDNSVLEKLHKVIVENATAKGYEALIKRPSDLFQVETSYMVMQNYKLVLVVHVPMVKIGHLLSLYQHIPIPLSQTFVTNSSIMPVVGDNDIIAVGVIDGKKHYKTLGQSDLLKCFKLGDTNICDGRAILQNNFGESCISSLWTQNLTGVLSHCDFEVTDKREEVYALSHDEFIVSSEAALYTMVKCKDYTRSIHVGPVSKVKVEHGCTVPLQNHVLIPNPEFVNNVDIINYAWTWDVKVLFQDMDEITANELIASLKEYGHHVMTVNDLQKWSIDNYSSPLVSRDMNTYLVIGLLCLAATLLLFALYFCLRSSNTLHQQQSAGMPDIPLQHLHYQPTAPFGLTRS